MNPVNPMNSIDEDTVRALLADAAGAPEPPSTISIEGARTAGRRRQWAARVVASGGVAVLVVGSALIAPHLRLAAAPASATGPSSATRIAAPVKPVAKVKPTPKVKPAAPAPAPAQFNPLELSANFGWLPSFWNEDGASVEETPTFTVVNLVDSQTLKVSPRGWYPNPTLYSSTRGSFPRAATDPKAPAVNGQPAYWDGNGLMWEYAPGAWAYLYSAGNVQTANGRALDEEMARKVVFGQHRPLYTPFKLTHGLPAGWQATETDSVLTNGRPLVWQLEAGPAAKPGVLTISGDTHAGTCGVQPPAQSWVMTGGIRWAYNYSSGPGGDQVVCAPTAIDGQYMTMYYYWRGHAQALNLASLLRSMKFFGPDPSGWTTQPIAG
jgi:hypothetical protein